MTWCGPPLLVLGQPCRPRPPRPGSWQRGSSVARALPGCFSGTVRWAGPGGRRGEPWAFRPGVLSRRLEPFSLPSFLQAGTGPGGTACAWPRCNRSLSCHLEAPQRVQTWTLSQQQMSKLRLGPAAQSAPRPPSRHTGVRMKMFGGWREPVGRGWAGSWRLVPPFPWLPAVSPVRLCRPSPLTPSPTRAGASEVLRGGIQCGEGPPGPPRSSLPSGGLRSLALFPSSPAWLVPDT